MNRGVEIEKGRVRKALPILFGPFQAKTALPELVPYSSVLLSDLIEAVLTGLGREAGGLLVGHVMHDVGDEARNLPQPERTTGAGSNAVFRDQAMIA